MNRIVLLFFSVLLFESQSLRAQEKEKMIVHQSTLIDALREEQTGNRDKAIGLLEKLKYEPEFKAVSLYYLARWYASDGKTAEAYQAITESVAAEPDNKWYLVFKANLAEEQGRYAETAETYQLLGKLEPEAYTHLDNTAFFYLKAGDPEKALDVLLDAEQKFGLLPPLAIKKSYVLQQTGKEKKALELLERCLLQYPNHTGLLEQLLQLSHKQKWKAGIEKYSGLLQHLDPGNTVLLQYRRPNPANPESQEGNLIGIISSEHYAMDDKIKFMIQNMEGLMRQSDTAGLRALIPFALQLVAQAPQDPKPYALAGDLYYQLDDLFSARQQYIQSTQMGPVPYTVWDNLLSCLIQIQHWNASIFYSESAMELYPAQSFPLYVLALSLFQEGQLEKALAELDNLEPMVQHNRLRKTEAKVLRAKCLAALKRLEEAEQIWSKELLDDPQHVVALEYAAYLAEQQKNIPAELMDKVIRSGFFDSANQSYLAARIYYSRKDYRKAKEMIDAGLAFPTSRTAAYRKLAAEIYSSSGDTARSEQFLLEARQWEEKPGDYPAIQGSPKFK